MKNEGESKLNEAIGKTIMETKYTFCHELDRLIQARKVKNDWESTVNRMIDYSSDAKFLTKKTKELIEYLINK